MDDGGPPEMTIAIAESKTANDLNTLEPNPKGGTPRISHENLGYLISPVHH